MAIPESLSSGDTPPFVSTKFLTTLKPKAIMKRLLNIRRAQPPQDPHKWVPILGELQKTLQKGEYMPLRPLPMFESNFVQVTNHGAPALVNHKTNRLTMGVAASLPGLVLPDILLLARPAEGKESCSSLVLTRMIPLDLAHLYVHDLPTWRLKLRLVTSRYYYLELDAHDHEISFLFDRWIRLINLLHEPTMSWTPRTMDTPPLDAPLGAAPASTWRLKAKSPTGVTVEVAERTFPYKMFSSQKQKKNKTLKRRFKSQAVGDSLPLIWSQQVHPSKEETKVTEKTSYVDTCPNRSKELIHVSDKASITIRTIFSIVSGTVNQAQPDSKGRESDSETNPRQGGLIETPTQCVCDNSKDLPFMDSYNSMDTFLWTRDFEDLVDTESTSLSSSLHTTSRPPAFYYLSSGSSFPKPRDKAKLMNSLKHREPPPSKKAAHAPVTTGKKPVIWDQSNKVPAEPVAAQKAPAILVPSQKAPALPVPCQKAQAIPVPCQKAPVIPVPCQKAPVILVPSQKAPALPVPCQKAQAIPVPCQKAQAIPVPSQKAPATSTQQSTQKSSPKPSLFYMVPPSVSQKAPSIPGPHQKVPVLIVPPPKALSPIPKHQQSLGVSPKARPAKKEVLVLDIQAQKAPADQYQKDPDSGTQALMGDSVLPVGDVPEGKCERKPEPVVLVGGQKKRMVDMRARAMSLHTPFSTTRKQSKEILISKAQEITLEDLKGRGKTEDRAHRAKEETTVNLPDLKSKEIGKKQKWVLTQEVAVEGPGAEEDRPFSVEGLALAKMMIIANSKSQHLKPAISLPSWLSLTSKGSGMSMLANLPLLEKRMSPVVIREQLGSHTKVKEGNTQQPMELKSPEDLLKTSKEPAIELPSSPVFGGSNITAVPQFPIAASVPTFCLGNVSHPDTSFTTCPVVKAESPVRAKRPSFKKAQMQQCPLAVAGSHSEVLLPVILEVDSKRKMSKKAEVPVKEVGVHHSQ